jgi:ABC-type Zn uptake system ZnuABC Zn-binding protein ZnuA
VVTTLSTYAEIAREIGGNLIEAHYLCQGDEDPHFVRPKPSFSVLVSKADLFVTTGLDLELWAPTVIDSSRNPRIREGQKGYVAVYDGIHLLERPVTADRSQGGVHIYGNPHIYTSPLNGKVIATNIAIGLGKVDPVHKKAYKRGLDAFNNEVDRRLFGPELVGLVGAETLEKLAESGNLIRFLREQPYQGSPLIDRLGGWMKEALPLRGKKIVTYHKNWVYFTDLFGLDVVAEVEPKPSIPPSPRDVERLIQRMQAEGVRVILAANYYDENKVRNIAQRVGARAVIVPVSVYGAPGVDTYFDLLDCWIQGLKEAFTEAP